MYTHTVKYDVIESPTEGVGEAVAIERISLEEDAKFM